MLRPVGKIPVLIGSTGMVAGEAFVLNDPCDVVIGRSRSCEVSLQSARRYQALTDDERARLDDFNSVSRRHVRLTVIGARARLDNLSQAGTVCNEQRFDRVLDIDLACGPAVIRLSANESLTLALADKEQIAEMLAKTRPLPGADPASNTPLSSAIRRPVDVGEGAKQSTWPSRGVDPDTSDESKAPSSG
ncbi:MAG: FHA domain-containing protein [Planctomycetes bacterium]|nr:FHA domain-containing protein [Planctomycetota bacterium]